MLVDSNTALRTLQPAHPQYQAASNAILFLSKRGEELCIVPQNLVEIWAVATRPVAAQNGLGMSTNDALEAVQRLKNLFTLLADTEQRIYDIWEALVVTHRVSGKASHDARLVAAMKVHGEKSILTFNGPDFRRYPDIEVIDPANVSLR